MKYEMSTFRKLVAIVAIALGGAGMLIMVSTDVEASRWYLTATVGFIMMMLGFGLGKLVNRPARIIGFLLGLVFVGYAFAYKRLKANSSNARKCFIEYKRNHRSYRKLFLSVYRTCMTYNHIPRIFN